MPELKIMVKIGLKKRGLVTQDSASAHSSTRYSKLSKSPLRQSLYLGLPEGLTKPLSAGTTMASGRLCKGNDLDDGVLMPKLL